MHIEPQNGGQSAVLFKTPAEMAKLHADLGQLDRDCATAETNLHDRAIVLIHACIDAGITDGTAIVGMVAKVGFNPRHVGKLLHDSIGDRWSRDRAGQYANLV